jgi:hypothetical protein
MPGNAASAEMTGIRNSGRKMLRSFFRKRRIKTTRSCVLLCDGFDVVVLNESQLKISFD